MQIISNSLLIISGIAVLYFDASEITSEEYFAGRDVDLSDNKAEGGEGLTEAFGTEKYVKVQHILLQFFLHLIFTQASYHPS
jgi:hypothetical protein